MRSSTPIVLAALVAMSSLVAADSLKGASLQSGVGAYYGVVVNAAPSRESLALVREHAASVTFLVTPRWVNRETLAPDGAHYTLAADLRASDAFIGLVVENAGEVAAALSTLRELRISVAVFVDPTMSVKSRASLSRSTGLLDVTGAATSDALREGTLVQARDADVLASMLDAARTSNCARVRRGDEVVPVVAPHYFARRGRARAVPEEMETQTVAVRRELAAQCRRGKAEPGDWNVPPPVTGDPCKANPLARVCR